MGWERGQGRVPPSLGGPEVLGGVVTPPGEVSDRAKAGREAAASAGRRLTLSPASALLSSRGHSFDLCVPGRPLGRDGEPDSPCRLVRPREAAQGGRLGPCGAPGGARLASAQPSISRPLAAGLLLGQGSTLRPSFAAFLCHLLLAGQVSLFVFPRQEPLCASKSRLNNQSLFACGRRQGKRSGSQAAACCSDRAGGAGEPRRLC